MSVTYIPTQNNAGNILGAIGAWDQFLGPTSQKNAQELTNSKTIGDAATQQLNAQKDLIPLTKSQQESAATQQKAIAQKAAFDQKNLQGQIQGWNMLPYAIQQKTSDQFSPEERITADKAYMVNGVTDLPNAYATHNATAKNVYANIQTPAGGVATEYNLNGVAGYFPPTPAQLANLNSSFGFSPQASAGTGGVPVPQLSVDPKAMVTPPSATAAGASTGAYQLPHINPALASDPRAARILGSMMDLTSKSQGLQKTAQEIDAQQIARIAAEKLAHLGTTEQQSTEGRVGDNLRNIFKDLEDFRDTLNNFGNYEAGWANESDDEKARKEEPGGLFPNPRASGKLADFPKRISAQFRAVENPGGALLKPGQAETAADNLFSMPTEWAGPLGNFFGPSTSKTLGEVGEQEKRAVRFATDQEHNPATHVPIFNLPPRIRALVGPPPQRLLDNAKAEHLDVSEFTKPPEGAGGEGTPGSPQVYENMAEFKAARERGGVMTGQPATVGGKVYVANHLTGQWEPQPFNIQSKFDLGALYNLPRPGQ